MTYKISSVSMRQRLCPKSLLGRMTAPVRFVVWGLMPVGALMGGVLGQTLGPRQAMWIGVLGELAASLPILLSPVRIMHDLPPTLDDAPEQADDMAAAAWTGHRDRMVRTRVRRRAFRPAPRRTPSPGPGAAGGPSEACTPSDRREHRPTGIHVTRGTATSTRRRTTGSPPSSGARGRPCKGELIAVDGQLLAGRNPTQKGPAIAGPFFS
ncbi:hypothetical protein [Streptomyces tropicalis]|uniref:Uncharacterized protein n=1 Tax=Streptomyces tropicalis TaxID=3034234 RepID=A0ABT6A722_9ACTN|nr:hypothetical protein [Streptomyces tropicalis]MDF3300171.1 hypothetical protein [Streptomyces tropicalis]